MHHTIIIDIKSLPATEGIFFVLKKRKGIKVRDEREN